jgi:ABC-type nickel/cobalt efflux system permease component RcnA
MNRHSLPEFTDPVRARRVRSRGGAHRRLAAAATATGLLLAVVVPATVFAHPLGNFTINHFAALRVAPDRVDVDVVIDRAEIPAFQERQRLDTNGDGTLQPAELAGQPEAECSDLSRDLRLTLNGAATTLSLGAAGLSFPPGAGGLTTMRLVCEYAATFSAPIAAGTLLAFEDRAFSERIGWREIVVLGDRTAVEGSDNDAAAGPAGVSNRLTSYPTDLLTQPLDMRSVSVHVTPGGPALPAWQAPDATPVAAGGTPSTAVSIGAVPGGVGQDLAALVDVQDLTPLAILVSIAIAFGLGVIHALSPGHGKTIMAAYLVGGRGSSRQAVGLGLAVTVSHTLGVLALALITLAAASVLPPERLYPVLGVASGGLVIAIGGSLLWQRLRTVLARRAHAHAHEHGHAHEHLDGHAPGHGHPHPHAHDDPGDSISWRGLLALGLSGGLVPSASALILLLGSIAAGRVAYGLVLVVAFGLGMAVVLAGIGLLLVHARRVVERRMAGGPAIGERLRRLVAPIQVATAGLVVVLGIALTGQALTQVL